MDMIKDVSQVINLYLIFLNIIISLRFVSLILRFTYLISARYVVEELSVLSMFDNHKDIWWCVNKLKVFDYVWMIKYSQNFDLSFHLFKYTLLLYLLFVHNLNSYLVATDFIDSHYKNLFFINSLSSLLTYALLFRKSQCPNSLTICSYLSLYGMT